MPLKCQFCQEESVVEEDVGDGREQLICVECGAVATSSATQPGKPVASTPGDPTCLDEEDDCNANVCQSCGETLQPEETEFCSECKDLEEPHEDGDGCVPVTPKADISHPSEQKVNVTLGSSQKACPSCGSLDLITDQMGTEEQIVCGSCGQVVGSQMFTNNESEISSTRTFGNQSQTLPRFAHRPGQCNGYKVGLERIVMVHQKLALSNHVKEEADEMFKRLFYMPTVVNKSIQSKEHIAVACVYIACRRDNLPVSMVHFSEFRDSSRLFIRAIKIVTTHLQIKLLPPALGTQVSQVFGSIHLGAASTDSAKMLSQVRDIMFLCRDAWLTSGRHCQPMILIALYYVYLNCDVCTKRIGLKQFCSMFNLPPISKKMFSDFQNLFLRLASHLPWAKQGQVKHSTIHLYINDIIKYKKSLLHLAFEKPETGKECLPWEKNSTVASPSCPKKDILMPASFKRAREAQPVARAPESSIPAHLDLDCPEIKASDFPEDEIASYIITSVELDKIKKAKENVFQEKRVKLK
ncbi:hypothetical protein EGW08_004528 [Elysia chlorotica]|uniref:Transcription factor IIIB 50 kDa subunit n=1 Tax=Elysia chlorotica TaxID=188477 RepID=A0A3S1BNE3_ELYCH|nr:hypothetical protein EGW08_004528 [Elysia chlorotica]